MTTELITSPLPGKILGVKVTAGDKVKEGDLLLTIEAMKMENEIVATVNGTVTEVMAKPDQVRYAYAGGVAACASLDAWLARRSGIDRPLDGVLRHLYDSRDGTPLSREILQEAVREVTGVDCSAWLDRYVYGKTALPLPDELI